MSPQTLEELETELAELPARQSRALIEGNGQLVNELKRRKEELPMLILAARVAVLQDKIRQLDIAVVDARQGYSAVQTACDDAGLNLSRAREQFEQAQRHFASAQAGVEAHRARVLSAQAERESAELALQELVAELADTPVSEPVPQGHRAVPEGMTGYMILNGATVLERRE